MASILAKLRNHQQILGIAVAGIILTVIFVPSQNVEAFTATTSLPNTTGNTLTQSASGSDFKVEIEVDPGELISVSTIEVIVDNTIPGVKRAVFSSTGDRILGDPSLVKDNRLTVTPSPSGSGYGYGFGLTSTGTTYSAPYSFIFTSSYAFVGGNNLGYSNIAGGTNAVTGFVGPTTITISGKLLTALMSTGSHTLDVLISTGAGGNGQDDLVAPQITFTVNANTQVTTTTISTGSNVQTTVTPPSGGTITITFNSVSTGGQVVVEEKTASSLDTETPTIFNTVGSTTSTFTVGTATGTTTGIIYEIDTSALTTSGTIDVTIPYDPALLPSGKSESDVRFFHWDGSAWQDVTIAVDTAANTVTGRLSSLSPVTTGVYTAGSGGSTTTTTTGGAGGGGTEIILNQTFPPEYFEIRPLQKLQLQESKFVNNAGNTVFGGKVGQQVNIESTFRNYQQVSQPYAIIVQIVDKDGFTTDLSWVTGVVDTAQTAIGSRSWTIEAAGDYTIKIFVWNGISQAPTPLSEVTSKTFTVTN